jgi:hypothetical protein
MTTEQEIFEKYAKVGAKDLVKFYRTHKPKENELALKGYNEVMSDMKIAISEAYEAGKLAFPDYKFWSEGNVKKIQAQTAQAIFEELDKYWSSDNGDYVALKARYLKPKK